MLKRSVRKLALLAMFIYIVFVNTGYTDADIFAERIVANNKFKAITLDFFVKNSFNSSPVNNLFHTSGIAPGGFDLGALKINTNNEDKFNYRLKVLMTNGDNNFCQNLHLKILDRNFFQIYSGSLLNANIDSKLSKATPKDYIFFLSLDDNNQSLSNKVCEFNFDFRTYHQDPEESGGIYAQRLISNIITSGSW